VTAGARADGARVGAAIGVLALAAGLSPSGWWLGAAIPAGAIAGVWAGPRVAPGAPIRARLVLATAAVATGAGAATIAAGLAVASESIRESGPLGFVGSWIALIALALLGIGWLALLVLLPVSAAALAIVRARATSDDLGRTTRRRSAWSGGLVVGLVSGFLALTLPVVGYEIALLFIAGALLARGSLAAVAGLSLGIGTGWTALMANQAATCRPPDCIPPDLGPWLAIGLVFVGVGVLMTVVAAARR
jgi:hypothetical protein